jgi:hypothetical protein
LGQVVPLAGVDAKSDKRNLKGVIEPARLLLDYAVAHGLVESPSIIDPIVKLESEIATGAMPNQLTLARFFKSYNALCKITYGVSAESLSAEAQRDQRRTRNIYFGFLAVLMLMAVPLTTISTVGSKLLADATAQISATCKDYPVFYCDAVSRNLQTTYDVLPYAKNDLISRTTHISQNLWVLAFFVDLLQGNNLRGELAKATPRNAPNIWSSFQQTAALSGSIGDRFKLYYGTLANYALPIIFGMLGAVTFGLRELRQKTEPPTWGRRDGALAVLRISTAGLAGYLVTVFGDLTAGLQISLILVAFLLGYSLDIFFTLLDRMVAYVKTAGSGRGSEPPVHGPTSVRG